MFNANTKQSLKNLFVTILLFAVIPSFTLMSTMSTAFAQEVDAELLRYGALSKRQGDLYFRVKGEQLDRKIRSDWVFVSNSDEIDARLGNGFGIHWLFTGLQGNQAQVEIQVKHPEFTDNTGNVVSGVKHLVDYPVINGVASHIVGYSLNAPYKLVKGDWQISVRCQGKTITKRFRLK